MLTQQEKRGILKKEFAEFSAKHDQYVPKEELFGFLDFKCHQQFDKAIAIQLYDHMPKDQNNFVTIDEFIQTYIDAEEILKDKVESSKHYLADYYKQRNEAEQKLNEVNQYEKLNLNQHGIMADSTLTVVVLDAQINRDPRVQKVKADPYVILECGHTKQQTQLSNMHQPEWNEQFVGDEDLDVQLYAFESEYKNQAQLIGRCRISLNTLRHQMKQEENYPLVDDSLKENRGSIKLSLQWIYSKTKYLQHVLEQWEDHIKMQEEDLIDYQRDLQTLYEPFPLLQKANVGSPMLTPISHTPKSGAAVSPHHTFRQGVEINGFENELDRSPVILTDNFHELYHASQYLAGALGLLELMAQFERCQFLDTLILMVFGYFYKIHDLNSLKLRYIAIAGLISFILDLPWLVINGGAWWQGQGLGDGGVYKFVLIMSFLIFFVKLSFVGVCGYLSSEFPAQGFISTFQRPPNQMNLQFLHNID